ncbi:UNVERIFIED_CONTAM: DNA-directed RNA polymerase II subunit RPB7 [Sesamum calycinum]|uniref:DNA-directed RNA polymerase subunit n=1 Tax=Sesamum calycinum TaxID=2727403 RepID=A0AAW2SE85_9LAMI
MFFHIVLERNMQLHPRHFGRDLRDKLVAKLMKDVEGTCSGRHGFIVAITGIESVGKGLIRDGTGFVTFPVKYQCVVFRPFKGEILEAVVTMVNKMGFFAEAGPVQIFVSNHLIPDDMEFQSGDIPNYTTSDGSVKIQKDSEVRLKIIGTRVDATEIAQTSLAQLLSRAVLLSYSLFTLILVVLSTASRSDNQLYSLIPIRPQILIFCLLSQFCIGTIKDDFLGVISDPGATS